MSKTGRKPLFSTRGWVLIAVVALATPPLFGVWPTSGKRIFAFLMLAWFGAFFAGAAAMILRREDPVPEALPEAAPDALPPGETKSDK